MYLYHTFSVMLLGFSWLLPAVPPAGADGGSGAPSAEALLQQVPESDEDIQKRTVLAQARLSELGQAGTGEAQLSEEDGKAVRAAQQELVQAWQAYLDNLQRMTTLRKDLLNLTSPEHLKTLADELAALDEEKASLKRSEPPATVTEEQLTELQARASALKAQVEALAESQLQRSKQLSEGFQSQEKLLQEDLSQTRTRREEVVKPLTEPSSLPLAPPEQQRLQWDEERLTVRQAVVQLALRALKPAAELARHTYDQGERRLGSMRPLLSALQDRINAINEARTRARMKELEVAEARSPTEMGIRDLKLFSERVLLAYFQEPERLRRLQERYPQRAADRLATRIQLAGVYWTRIRESLDYQDAKELKSLAEELSEQLQDERSLLDGLRTKLGKTLDELQQLQSVRERALRRFNAQADQVTSTVDRKDAARRTQVQSMVTTERTALVESMGTVIAAVEEVSARLGLAVDKLEAHVEGLDTVGETLRWMRLTNRDAGIWGSHWTSAWSDVAAFWRPPPPEALEDRDSQTARSLHRELFGERRDAYADWRLLGGKMMAGLRSTTVGEWAWTLIGVLVVAGVGGVLHRVTRYHGVRLAREIVEQLEGPRDEAHPIRTGLSARINLMLLNMVGDLSIPVLVACALAFSAWHLASDDTTIRLVLTFLGTIVFAMTLLRLVHHLFEAESPPHRPIPCSDRVARHYRKWIGIIIVFSAIALIIPLMLLVATVAGALQAVLLELYKTGLLALLLLFLFRKECVLGLGDVGDLNWGLMLTWIAYPLLVLAVIALLVLEVIGYGALVSYVGTGLLLSFGILMVLGTLIEYLSDLIERRAWQLQHPDAAAGPGGASPASRSLESGRSLYVIALLRWFVRISGLGLIVYLMLRAWDVRVTPATMDWGRIGLGVLSIFVALLLDRLILTLLSTLHMTGRMPESTIGIIRRWLRGVLTIVVALTVIAIAGFDVKSLWTLLATFLAMIAIGFVAVWSILSNVLATIVILIWRPFNVGERISVLPEDLEGEVVDINFIYTTLKADDGSKMSIPNNLFAQKFIRRQEIRGKPVRTLAEQLESEKPLGE